MPNAVERAKVQYFYSLASPWAYLGAQRLIDLCADKGVVIEAFPIATFKDNGWIPLMEKPANRQAYVALDLKRWVSRLGLPMVTQDRPAGMAGLGDALPMIYAAQLAGVDALALAVALQKAYREECIDVGLPAPRAAVATAAGFDGAALSAMETTPEVAAQREAMFDAARAAGVFGSPTYVFNGELFWGQDRLDFLAEAISAEGGAA
ncbi:2-hydroxychromene-2-carboxylate isomerase [Ketogulonicigenium vulgare]|uniref:2-hydroxychromene-2-carboxylate isomerase n=1 Tax=Ketogulonicigenium vulgare TaxID=92945 RepID=UPI00235924A9|nr:DsbA family protein [Ketogulonicigenium vulgare]